MVILHIATRVDWNRAQVCGEYQVASLDTEGFIHCSEINQVIRVADYVFKRKSDLVLLVIKKDRVESEIRYENGSRIEKFPHIYGPLNLSAITKVLEFNESKNGFHLPTEITNIRPILIEGIDKLEINNLISLYESIGWSNYTDHPQTLYEAVRNSSYVVCAYIDGCLIGLARSLSDESAIHYLQDILVLPDFQRKGIGRLLMETCLNRFKHVRSHVLLTDDESKQHKFYRTMGFKNTKKLKKIPLNCFVKMDSMKLA